MTGSHLGAEEIFITPGPSSTFWIKRKWEHTGRAPVPTDW